MTVHHHKFNQGVAPIEAAMLNMVSSWEQIDSALSMQP